MDSLFRDERIPTRRAMLVDDDDGVRRSLLLLLRWLGYEVRAFASAASLLDADRIPDAEFLITDYRLDDATGMDVLRHLRGHGWDGHAVLITAFADSGVRAEADRTGFAAVLDKPFGKQALVAALQN